MFESACAYVRGGSATGGHVIRDIVLFDHIWPAPRTQFSIMTAQ